MWAGVLVLLVLCGYLFWSVRKHRREDYRFYEGKVVEMDGYKAKIVAYDPRTKNATLDDWEDPPDDAA